LTNLYERGKFVACSEMKSNKRINRVDLGGLVVIVLAVGPKVGGFKAGRGRRIFKSDKNPLHDFLRRGSKAVGPMS
jgi:hypothetical protein